MRACSMPSTMNRGQRMSRNVTAAKSSGKGKRGAARFARNPTAKCPTNTSLGARVSLGDAKRDEALVLEAPGGIGGDVVAVAKGAFALVGADGALGLLGEPMDLFR